MFKEIVSQLSLSPSTSSRLVLYTRKLKGEQSLRLLSVIAAVLIVGLQLAMIVAPPSASNSSSLNDLISGGFVSKEDLLSKYDSSIELRQVYSYLSINRKDIEGASVKTVNSHADSLSSISRLRFDSKDTGFSINGRVYWARALDHTDSPINAIIGSNYRVLEDSGKSNVGGDKEYFAIVFSSGNAFVKHDTLTRSLSANKPAVLVESASAESTPSPSATPCPASIYKSLAAFNVAQDADAVTVTAKPGDIIRYTLSTKNVCGSSVLNYQVTDQIQDVLEYADIIDSAGATQTSSSLIWPTEAITPNETLDKTFMIRIKSPIPTTPTGTTDPLSYDLHVDNNYGNDIRINVEPPLAKTVEATSGLLPVSGPGPVTAIVLLVAGFVLFFYFRNRQLLTEIKHLRNDYDGGIK